MVLGYLANLWVGSDVYVSKRRPFGRGALTSAPGPLPSRMRHVLRRLRADGSIGRLLLYIPPVHGEGAEDNRGKLASFCSQLEAVRDYVFVDGRQCRSPSCDWLRFVGVHQPNATD
jgi:hypothetical protein